MCVMITIALFLLYIIMAASPPQSPSFSQPSFSTRPSLAISATVRWTIRTAGRSRPATKYEVKCSNDNYNSHVISATTTTLYSLQPCALYTCCVKGIDSNGAAGAVNCLSFRTPFSSMAGKVVIHDLNCMYTILLQRERIMICY